MARNNPHRKDAQALAISTDGDDQLIGTRNAEEISGGLGNDTIIGGYGSDTLIGDDGNDTLWGYNEWGVPDVLVGGAGSDTFVFNHPGESLNADGQRDVIADFETGVDKIDLSSEYMAGITADDITITATGFTVDFHYDGNDLIPDPWMAVDVTGTIALSDFVFA